MHINQESVNAYKTILLNPTDHGFSFTPIDKSFVKCDTVTAKDRLFEAYARYIDMPLRKVMFYIIMEEIHGPGDGKDIEGNLGYKLRLAGCDILYPTKAA